MPSRMELLLQRLESLEVDGLFTRRPSHIAYLLGFHASAGMALFLRGRVWLIVDSRYHQQAIEQASEAEVVLAPHSLEETLQETLQDSLKGDRPRIGLEGDQVSLAFKRRLDSWDLSCVWLEVDDPIADLRVVKTPREIALLENAFRAAQAAFGEAEAEIVPGMTEGQAAGVLEMHLRQHGGQAFAFDTIVAAGERSALPHSLPSGREWHQGEPLLVDFGMRRDGYCTDLTRVLGVDSENAARVAQIVCDARQAAFEAIRPDARGSDVDAAAREWIEKRGYGDFFGHGTGHGVGLEIHERPRISPRGQEVLREGMVFTIEPGIYLPGEFGVRIEDVVRVTDDGFAFVSNPDL